MVENVTHLRWQAGIHARARSVSGRLPSPHADGVHHHGQQVSWETMSAASEVLTEFGVPHECRVVFAHRTPELMAETAVSAEGRRIEVIIAGAGGAAHLPGMTAAHTTLPVLGVPIESRSLKGLDSRCCRLCRCPPEFPSRRWQSGLRVRRMRRCWPFLFSPANALACGPNSKRFANGRNAKYSKNRCREDRSARLDHRRAGQRPARPNGRHLCPPRGPAIAFHTYSPDRDSPTGQIADIEIDAAYQDLDRVRAFASAVDVVTFEFENVPAATAEAAAQCALVRPAGGVLHTTQHRLRERAFSCEHGFPFTRFRGDPPAGRFAARRRRHRAGHSEDRWIRLRRKRPVSCRFARRNRSRLERDEAAEQAVLEALVDFEAELSVIGVRGVNGACVFFTPSCNHHVNGILDVSYAPAAIRYAKR